LQNPTLLLGHLLVDNWNGKYELAKLENLGKERTGVRWLLLAEDVYGGSEIRNDRLKKVKALANRYQDWSMSDREENQWALGTGGHALMNPYNVDADVWRKNSIFRIKLDIWRFDASDWKRWYSFWERTDVFRKNRSLFRQAVEEYIGEECEDTWYWGAPEIPEYPSKEIIEENEFH
jgi:hypothetical protein